LVDKLAIFSLTDISFSNLLVSILNQPSFSLRADILVTLTTATISASNSS
jgi:hypothetical protein